MDAAQQSFEDAFRAEYSGVVRVCAPIVGSVVDAEAVAQEAFLKALTRWRRVRGYDRPGAWIRRVAIRDAVRFAEGRRRTAEIPNRSADLAEVAAVRLDLVEALGQLPPRQRACVVLHYLADWSTKEVAEALVCSEATVRVHLHRARTALATSLAVDPEGLPHER